MYAVIEIQNVFCSASSEHISVCELSNLPTRVVTLLTQHCSQVTLCAGWVCAPVSVVSRVCFSLPLPPLSSLHPESRRPLLPPSSSLSQRDATAYRSVCQNQRCLGNPSRIPAVDQETGKWAVWGSMDGYAKPQLLYY